MEIKGPHLLSTPPTIYSLPPSQLGLIFLSVDRRFTEVRDLLKVWLRQSQSSCFPTTPTRPLVLSELLKHTNYSNTGPFPPNTVNMRTFNTFALGLIGAAVASASDVESLTGTTFPDFVKENPLVLAECKFPFSLVANSACTPSLTFYSLRSMFLLISQVH